MWNILIHIIITSIANVLQLCSLADLILYLHLLTSLSFYYVLLWDFFSPFSSYCYYFFSYVQIFKHNFRNMILVIHVMTLAFSI